MVAERPRPVGKHETSDAPRLTGWALVRNELGLMAELAGLVGLAVVQPVLGPFGSSPETFTAFGATPGTIVAFAVLVVVVPVLLVWALAAVTRVFGDQVRDWAQTVVVGVLAALAVTYLARQASLTMLVRAGAAMYLGGLAALIHHRWAPGRLFLRYASPLPVLVAGVFLFASPVAPLVLPSSAPERAATGRTGLTPVVMIVLDELPALSLVDGTGGIDPELVPNLARLAATSTWYRNHTSASPATGSSLPVMLTGKDPEDPAATPTSTDAQFPDNLLSRLAPDYEVHGAEWATDFCPDGLCSRPSGDLGPVASALQRAARTAETSPLGGLIDEGRSLWWSQVWPLADDFDAGFTLGGTAQIDDQRRRTLEFLDGIAKPSGDKPVFDYLHTALPHQPWNLLPSGRSYNAPDFPFGGEFLRSWPEGDFGRELALGARVQHLLQVQWADRILGAVFDRLDQVGRWDDALVVVTADHGVSFQPGTSLRDVVPANQVDLAWAPLFVKLPGQQVGSIDDADVSSLDLLPTILDVSGMGADPDLPGRSLASGPVPPDRPRPFIAPASAGFDTQIRDGIVALDGDGLAALRSGGQILGYPGRRPGDDLAVWRHGRHGDLLGQTVDDLGVCAEQGPKADRTVPEDWGRYAGGTLPADAVIPLWQEGSVAGTAPIDVAAVVDGRVAGWGVTIPKDGVSRFGVLVAEPLVPRGAGDPELYQVVDQPGCRLRPVEG